MRAVTNIIRRPSPAGCAVVCLLGMWLAAACGGSASRGGSAADRVIVIEGQVSSRGSTPFPQAMVVSAEGTTYAIESSELGDELLRLEQMRVRVTGKLVPALQGDVPMLSVISYELLPFETGERPIVGFVEYQPPSEVYVRDIYGTRYRVVGEFERVLMDYAGAKVWVAGDPEIDPNDLGARTIMVSEYGVIRAVR
jgi:hypothetical protein